MLGKKAEEKLAEQFMVYVNEVKQNNDATSLQDIVENNDGQNLVIPVNDKKQGYKKRKLSVIQETPSIPTLTFQNSEYATSKMMSSDRNGSIAEAEYAQVDLINVLKKKRSATLSSSLSGSADGHNLLSTKRLNGAERKNCNSFTNTSNHEMSRNLQVSLTADMCSPKNFNNFQESMGFSRIRGKQVMSEEASRYEKSEIFDAVLKPEMKDVGTLTDDIYHNPPDK